MVRDFASIIASISTRGEGRVFLFDKEIFIFTDEKRDVWQIATKVSSRGNSEIREFMSYSFTDCGFLAIKDYAGKGIYFIYEVPPLNRYVFFQKTVKKYLEEADSWCKIFE